MANRYGSIQSDTGDQANGSVTRATSNGSPHHHDNPITQYLDKQLLNKDTDEQLEVIGYADRTVKKVFFWLLVILTAGLLLLLMYWKPEWKLKLTKTTCSLRRADTVLLKDIYGNVHIEPVVLISLIDGPIAGDSDTLQVYTIDVGSVTNSYDSCDILASANHSRSMGEFAYMEGEDGSHPADADDTTVLTLKVKVYLKYFDHRHVRYMWDQALLIFVQLRGLETGVTCGDLHDKYTGLSLEEQAHKLQVYGKNSIEVHVKSYFKLFFQEILNPFYIFQICSVILWSLDSYYIYASCIVLISAISLGVELYETRKQSETLHDMVMSAETTITVVRAGGELLEVPTSQLVPGDVIVIPAQGCLMACDAVLISGNAIVNESMLTGESVPVTKTPIGPSDVEEEYSPEKHRRHTLFSGTQVIQTRYYGDAKVKAVVVRTGFNTAKGELVRSILYPKPMGFKFYQDSMKFIGFLACIAGLGMIYSIVTLIREGAPAGKVVLRALDIVTIVVPPALPAAMTVGTAYAQSRLKKQGIFCISPPRINIAGKLKLIVFDKTGTLTEDGMDLWGIVPMDGNILGAPSQNPTTLPDTNEIIIAMATCHSLTIIDNELTGDPLDLKMFQSINWVIEEPGRDTTKFDSLMPTVVKPIRRSYDTDNQSDTPFEVGIVRQFTFSSSLQRMSVMVRVLGAPQMDIYVKGAPEKVASLCKKDTLPEDFVFSLHRFTKQGYRVIALAMKSLDPKITWHMAQRIPREQVESDLTFLGLLIMENMLKPQTAPVIWQLQAAEIRTVMATGDNILTAVSVAHQCGMIGDKERVIMVNAFPPDTAAPAKIEWQLADMETQLPGNQDTNPSDQPAEPSNRTQSHSNRDNEDENGEEMRDALDSMSGDPAMGNIQVRSPNVHDELYQQVSLPVDLEVPSGRYHFALTGRSFGIIRHHFPELLHKICVRGTVFARMSPDQKSQLVELLQDLGYCVGMCGDGANDCGALKAAHVGISLSEAEASVASPFTSKTANIECVPTLIREGRAALVTSFGVFKYMALYSIIQFVSVLILYTMETNFSDWMFLYIDLVITTTVAFLMGHTAAYPHLVAKRPPGSLVGPGNIISIILHILIVCSFQVFAFLYLVSTSWYAPPLTEEIDNYQTYETTVIFYVSAFQYLMLAFVFSKGPPYRKPLWTNVPFLIALIILLALNSLLVLYPFQFIKNILMLMDIPKFTFRLTLLGMVAVNFLIAFILETFIIPSMSFNRCANAIRRKKGPKNKYKLIEWELAGNQYWPLIGGLTLATGHATAFCPDQISVQLENR